MACPLLSSSAALRAPAIILRHSLLAQNVTTFPLLSLCCRCPQFYTYPHLPYGGFLLSPAAGVSCLVRSLGQCASMCASSCVIIQPNNFYWPSTPAVTRFWSRAHIALALLPGQPFLSHTLYYARSHLTKFLSLPPHRRLFSLLHQPHRQLRRNLTIFQLSRPPPLVELTLLQRRWRSRTFPHITSRAAVTKVAFSP